MRDQKPLILGQKDVRNEPENFELLVNVPDVHLLIDPLKTLFIDQSPLPRCLCLISTTAKATYCFQTPNQVIFHRVGDLLS